MTNKELTAKAEATIYPENWGVYYFLRTQLGFSISQACNFLVLEGYDYYAEADFRVLRQLEILTNNTECAEPAPCTCPRCQ